MRWDGERGNGMESEKKVRGKRRKGMGCSAAKTVGGQRQGQRWLMTAAWSRTLSPTDGSAIGGEEILKLCQKKVAIKKYFT